MPPYGRVAHTMGPWVDLPIRWARDPRAHRMGNPLHMGAIHDLNVSMSFCTANWGRIVMHAIRNG